jgi:hypothetical protein
MTFFDWLATLPYEQWLSLAALALLAVLVALAQLCRLTRVVVRGYPPTPRPDSAAGRRDCDNDDNLTGKCLKAGQGCRTTGECDQAVHWVSLGLRPPQTEPAEEAEE